MISYLMPLWRGVGVAIMAAVFATGCADVGPGSQGDQAYDLRTERADNASGYGRVSRNAWMSAMALCKSAYDETVGEGEASVAAVVAFEQCIVDANSATFLYEAPDAYHHGYRWGAYGEFESYRIAYTEFCSRISGIAVLESFEEQARYARVLTAAQCRVKSEFSLIRQLLYYADWEEGYSGDAIDVALTYDILLPVGQASDADACADQNWYPRSICVTNATRSALELAQRAAFETTLSADALEAHIAATRASVERLASLGESRCGTLEGFYVGSRIQDAQVSACIYNDSVRRAGIAEYFGGVRVAADAETDPDRDGIPGVSEEWGEE